MRGCFSVLAALLLVAFASSARADDDLAALRAELERQHAALERLERSEAERAQHEHAQDEPILRVSGYAQVDWVLHNQASQDEVNYSTGAPLNQDRFALRRGHLRFVSEQPYLSGALELDANTNNGAQLRPLDAEITLHWPDREDPKLPYFALSAGLMKIPFGLEVPELDVVRPFLERSNAARAFFPGEFDLGARFRAKFRFLDLGIAVMNGHPVGDRVFPALTPNQKKEIVGHLGVHAELTSRIRLEVGVSADTGSGFHAGNGTSKDQLFWRDENGDGIVQATEVQVIAGTAATPSQVYHRFALGADARLMIRFASNAGFELRGEVIRASNLDRALEPADPVGSGHDLRELGWYLGATQEITAWGLVGVRYDRYDPDQDASEGQAVQLVPRDRSYSTLALLALVRYGNAHLALEYDRNRNALGRSANGNPMSLASDALTARAQLRF